MADATTDRTTQTGDARDAPATVYGAHAPFALVTLLLAAVLVIHVSQRDVIGAAVWFQGMRAQEETRDFRMEGPGDVTVGDDGMVLGSRGFDGEIKQAHNFVLWTSVDAGPSASIEWTFVPRTDRGLAMLVFGAKAADGRDIFDPSLPARTGDIKQYQNGDLDGFTLSYYRTGKEKERASRIVVLRRLAGGALCAQAPDPIAPASEDDRPHRMRIDVREVGKGQCRVTLHVDDLAVLDWTGAAPAHGTSGRIGFRQMAPLFATYRDLRVVAAPE
jgi:hypothetical protein